MVAVLAFKLQHGSSSRSRHVTSTLQLVTCSHVLQRAVSNSLLSLLSEVYTLSGRGEFANMGEGVRTCGSPRMELPDENAPSVTSLHIHPHQLRRNALRGSASRMVGQVGSCLFGARTLIPESLTPA